MTERKTAEIKFRVSPDTKARWQAQAESEQVTLSELIRRAMEREMNPIMAIGPIESHVVTGDKVIDMNTGEVIHASVAPRWPEPCDNAIQMLDPDESQFSTLLQDVPTSDEADPGESPWPEHGYCDCGECIGLPEKPKPWMYEAKRDA